MATRWRSPLDAQRRARFAGLAGSEGVVQLRLSDALSNELIAGHLPASWPVSELTVHALEDNELVVRVRPRTAWLPPVQIHLRIDPQPVTPIEPLLRARFTSGLGTMAGAAIGAVRLPGWLRVSGDDVVVDVAALAAHYDVADLLPLMRTLTVRTEPGHAIVTIALSVT